MANKPSIFGSINQLKKCQRRSSAMKYALKVTLVLFIKELFWKTTEILNKNQDLKKIFFKMPNKIWQFLFWDCYFLNFLVVFLAKW